MSVADKLRAMFGNPKNQDVHYSTSNSSGPLKDLQKEINDIDQMIKDMKAAQQATIGFPSMPSLPGMPSPSSVGSLTVSYPQSLSRLEEKELKDLEADLNRQTKQAKLAYFRNLPREFRQSIINVLMWDEATEEMDKIQVNPSSRLEELRIRSTFSGSGNPFFTRPLGGFHSGSSSQWPPPGIHFPAIKLPSGITLEELISAHADASMEEELTRGEE